MSYSANDEFRKLVQNLGFEFALFDDPATTGKGVTLREKSKNGEIDAMFLDSNIIAVVGINGGSSDDVDKSRRGFFEKLDKITKYSELKLELQETGISAKANSKAKVAVEGLVNIKRHISQYTGPYKECLLKIFFCPKKVVEPNLLDEHRSRNELIIDKDIYEYFKAIIGRLPREYLLSDFYYFIGLKKSDRERVVQGKTIRPAKSSPYSTTKLDVSAGSAIYTLTTSVKEIMQWVTVLRIAGKYNKKGFQRMVKVARLKKISDQYLKQNETFPNNIIVALSPEIYIAESDFYSPENKEFTFLDEYNSLLIIDGQHRFFSFIYGSHIHRPIIISLIHFKHTNRDEQYLQMYKMFYEINKKSERLDPNLAFNLVAKIDPDSDEFFWNAVFGKLLTSNQFFSNHYTFRETTFKESGKKSIVSVVQYGGVINLLRSTKKNGLSVDGLDMFFGNKNQDQKEFFTFTLIQNYFDIIESVLYIQAVPKNQLSPRDIGALFRLMRHFILSGKKHLQKLGETRKLKTSSDRENKDAYEYFHQLISSIDFRKTIALDLSSSNWAAVEGVMLRQIHKNRQYKDFGNKLLLSKKGFDFYAK